MNKAIHLLIAEDDEDDYLLIMEAMSEAGFSMDTRWVKDGEELMDYLNNTATADSSDNPLPSLILLDLNMPKKDGREALSEIKADSRLSKIPVVVMTTSKAEADITHTYELGVNSFIQKPLRFGDFVEIIKVVFNYWFNIVTLPA